MCMYVNHVSYSKQIIYLSCLWRKKKGKSHPSPFHVHHLHFPFISQYICTSDLFLPACCKGLFVVNEDEEERRRGGGESLSLKDERKIRGKSMLLKWLL